MKNKLILLFALIWLFNGCNEPATTPCKSDDQFNSSVPQQNFFMGFTAWSYGSEASDVDATYQFILSHGDMYGEQIDDNIPWSAWINNTSLPSSFADNVAQRAARKPTDKRLQLQVSFLNDSRSDIMEDLDGTVPDHTALNDAVIEDAYVKHLEYLVENFEPDYLVIGMEVNELLLASAARWEEYKLLMLNVRNRIKSAHPTLKLTESVTLHNWYNPTVANPAAYIAEVDDYVNQLDFIGISFYPFLKGFHSKADFQLAFDFLHQHATKTIAFTETAHLAETLDIDAYDTHIGSDACEQNAYLEALLTNAYEHQYEFLVWFTFRDYDKLWETLPSDSKDLAKIWRDTGLLDGNGKERTSFNTWSIILSR